MPLEKCTKVTDTYSTLVLVLQRTAAPGKGKKKATASHASRHRCRFHTMDFIPPPLTTRLVLALSYNKSYRGELTKSDRSFLKITALHVTLPASLFLLISSSVSF
jgi:hypothetical protein